MSCSNVLPISFKDSEAILWSVLLKSIEIYISASAAPLSDCFFRWVFWGRYCWQASVLKASRFFLKLRRTSIYLYHSLHNNLSYQKYFVIARKSLCDPSNSPMDNSWKTTQVSPQYLITLQIFDTTSQIWSYSHWSHSI